MTDEYNLVDDAGKRFAADADAAITRYHAEIDKLVQEKHAAMGSAERIKQDAEDAYHRGFEESRTRCIAFVRKAAQAQAAKSERPDDITEVCESFVKPLETGGTFDPSYILDRLQEVEQARRDSAHVLERKRRWASLVRGTV